MSNQLFSVESLEHFLGQTWLDSAIESVDRDAFLKRFKTYHREILRIKAEKLSESSVEHAIQELMAQPIKELGGKLDLNKGDNYDVIVKNSSDALVTLLECKKVKTSEMVSLSDLNKKALQQLIYYYLNEIIKDKKTTPTFQRSMSIKHVMISNGFTWLVWKEEHFYALVTQSFMYNGVKTNLAKVQSEIKSSQENYPIIEDYIREVGVEHFKEKCYLLDLNPIDDIEALEDEKWNVLYHFFSAPVWLGHSAYLDANSLNAKFYHELLHVMGLKEVEMQVDEKAKKESDGAKMKIIVPNPDAVNSIYYNILRKKFRAKPTEEIHELAFQVLIVWINRILFLKLFEAHLVNVRSNPSGSNRVNYAFMAYHPETIGSWSDLDYLFFQVLSQEPEHREERIKSAFKHIPYLNSSLFMKRVDLIYREDEEDAYGIILDEISTLDNEPLALYKGEHGSVLAYEGVKEMPLLEYLLKFLSAYSFTTDGKSKVQGIESRLINASVLGNVFEKLNGYKDGSFYTPSFITTYICKESMQEALVGRVNAEMQENFADYSALKKAFKKMDEEEEKQLHGIIRSLTVLDPAVGSGHFLVSALNELISIRYDFMMFESIHPKDGLTLSVLNDEIMILNSATKKPLNYTVYDSHTQSFQEELFHAKEEIIEHNLFGVDINPNSVEICRLRLWIELLKNSYYLMDATKELASLDRLKSTREYVPMATLPNIDINIKTGNSLLYHISLEDKQDDNDLLTSNLPEVIKRYTQLHHDYIKTRSAKDRKALDKAIAKMKKEEFPILFGMTSEQKPADIEWRYLFPKSLDKKSGAFVGFDVVVGNPPYIQLQSMGDRIKKQYEAMKYQTFTKSGDIYMLFYELGIQLLRSKAWGQMGMITSNKWMLANYGEKLRKHLTEQVKVNTLIDLNGYKAFENATVDTNLLIVNKFPRKDPVYYSFPSRWKPEGGEILNLYDELAKQLPMQLLAKADRFILKQEAELAILQKVQAMGKPLGKWDVTINYGIKTGLNEAFYLSTAQKDALIAQDAKSAEIIVPMLRGKEIMPYHQHVQHKEWLIATHNGIKAKGIPAVDVEAYPAIKNHLDQFETALKKRGDKGSTHYNLRDCAYWEDFAKPKMFWTEISKYVAFVYKDEKHYINNAASMIVSEDSKKLKYLTGILNSHLYFYLWPFYLPALEGERFQVRQTFLVQVPILVPTPAQEAHVVALVDAIIAAKQALTSSRALEQELDAYIFALYGLTDDQIALVRATPKPTKE